MDTDNISAVLSQLNQAGLLFSSNCGYEIKHYNSKSMPEYVALSSLSYHASRIGLQLADNELMGLSECSTKTISDISDRAYSALKAMQVHTHFQEIVQETEQHNLLTFPMVSVPPIDVLLMASESLLINYEPNQGAIRNEHRMEGIMEYRIERSMEHKIDERAIDEQAIDDRNKTQLSSMLTSNPHKNFAYNRGYFLAIGYFLAKASAAGIAFQNGPKQYALMDNGLAILLAEPLVQLKAKIEYAKLGTALSKTLKENVLLYRALDEFLANGDYLKSAESKRMHKELKSRLKDCKSIHGSSGKALSFSELCHAALNHQIGWDETIPSAVHCAAMRNLKAEADSAYQQQHEKYVLTAQRCRTVRRLSRDFGKLAENAEANLGVLVSNLNILDSDAQSTTIQKQNAMQNEICPDNDASLNPDSSYTLNELIALSNAIDTISVQALAVGAKSLSKDCAEFANAIKNAEKTISGLIKLKKLPSLAQSVFECSKDYPIAAFAAVNCMESSCRSLNNLASNSELCQLFQPAAIDILKQKRLQSMSEFSDKMTEVKHYAHHSLNAAIHTMSQLSESNDSMLSGILAGYFSHLKQIQQSLRQSLQQSLQQSECESEYQSNLSIESILSTESNFSTNFSTQSNSICNSNSSIHSKKINAETILYKALDASMNFSECSTDAIISARKGIRELSEILRLSEANTLGCLGTDGSGIDDSGTDVLHDFLEPLETSAKLMQLQVTRECYSAANQIIQLPSELINPSNIQAITSDITAGLRRTPAEIFYAIPEGKALKVLTEAKQDYCRRYFHGEKLLQSCALYSSQLMSEVKSEATAVTASMETAKVAANIVSYTSPASLDELIGIMENYSASIKALDDFDFPYSLMQSTDNMKDKYADELRIVLTLAGKRTYQMASELADVWHHLEASQKELDEIQGFTIKRAACKISGRTERETASLKTLVAQNQKMFDGIANELAHYERFQNKVAGKISEFLICSTQMRLVEL